MIPSNYKNEQMVPLGSKVLKKVQNTSFSLTHYCLKPFSRPILRRSLR